MDVDLLKSINERLAKLDILDILREDINALCASLELRKLQIDDLRKENTALKGTVDSIHSKVEVVQREKKQLKETLLDVQCRSMRNKLIFSGIHENDNSRGCCRIAVKINFKTFNHELFLNDLAAVPWELIYVENDLNHATECFIDLLMEVMDHHGPSPWIDDELGEAFSQRNMAKVLATKSKLEIDEQNYRTLRNYAVKLNRRKKQLFYNNAFIDCKTDSKKGMDHS